MASSAQPRTTSAISMTRRRSKRSLTKPPNSSSRICGTDIAIIVRPSAVGRFDSSNTCQAIATSVTPSPISDTVMPAHRRRKPRSRERLQES